MDHSDLNDLWQVVPRQVFTFYDLTLISLALVIFNWIIHDRSRHSHDITYIDDLLGFAFQTMISSFDLII